MRASLTRVTREFFRSIHDHIKAQLMTNRRHNKEELAEHLYLTLVTTRHSRFLIFSKHMFEFFFRYNKTHLHGLGFRSVAVFPGGGHRFCPLAPLALAVIGELHTREMVPSALLLLAPLGPVVVLLRRVLPG